MIYTKAILIAALALTTTLALAPLAAADEGAEGEEEFPWSSEPIPGYCVAIRPGSIPPVTVYECP